MNNIIKCQNCGADNRAGEASCARCNARFQYKCPRCQSAITGGDPSCGRCGQPLTWLARQAAGHQVEEKQPAGRKPGGTASWLLPLIGLVVVIAAAGAGVYWVKTMIEAPRPAIFDNTSTSGGDGTFVPDRSGPKISAIGLTKPNYNSVRITWATDEPSDSQVIWRIKDGVPQTSELKEALGTSHFIELTNLKSKATYYYQVRSVDTAGNESFSAEKTFDIGIERGALKVEVAWSAIKTVELQPSVFKTIINGEIKNSGDSTLNISEIEVSVTVTVAGKPGTSVVKASLDPYPLEIYPLTSHKFTAEVPSRTEPVYTVDARIVGE